MSIFSFLRPKRQIDRDLTDRYRARPLIALLDSYVMSVIGYLDAEKEKVALDAARTAFGGGDDWRGTVRATLQLDSSLDTNIRQLWTTNQDIAKRESVILAPEDFAMMLVDENSAHLVDRVQM